MGIKAVIFDWGGVMIDDPAPGLMRYCAEALGVTREQYTQVHSAMCRPFQEGRVTEEVFWQGVCGQLGCAMPMGSLWGEAFQAVYAPRQEMFDLVVRLRGKGCRTALLSNTEPPCVRHLRGLGDHPFDVLVFSCVEGVCKPDRRIYERALKRLGVSGQEAVFVDDRPEFVEGARQVDLRAVLFEGAGPLQARLAAMGMRL
ncbi:MAG: HAD family phosphatase [Phycisphaerae bacterium]|nr:HAD family phosphatase [Phycisphaerae bacterium]